jgi:hypothetical protein
MSKQHLRPRGAAAMWDIGGGFLLGVLVALLVGGGLDVVLIHFIFSEIPGPSAFGVGLVAAGLHLPAGVLYVLKLAPRSYVKAWLYSTGQITSVIAADVIASIAGILAGSGAAWWAAAPRPVRQVRGRKLIDGHVATKHAAREFAPAVKRTGAGIQIAAGVPIDLERETRGFLLLGGIGSGKTTIIRSWLDQIAARGDKLILYDVKGDYTAVLTTLGLPFALIAPWDARSCAWDMAADIETRAAARAWAGRMIEESREPMWSNGARMILAGLVQAEIEDRPGAWGPQQIAEAAQLPYPQFRDRVLQYAPEAAQLLGAPDVETGAPSRTVQSFLANLVAFLAPIFDLADAFSDHGHGGPLPRISIRRWLLDEAAQPRVIVVQGHGNHDLMARGLMQTVVGIVAATVGSPQLPDAPERRIWMVLDELPQLRRIEGLPRLLETGRSKGLRMVFCVQDMNQIVEHYGQSAANALTAMVGTIIAGRTGGKETPEWISALIGTGQFLFPQTPGGVHPQQLEEHPVVSPDELGSLGVHDGGVEALLIPGQDRVYRLTWPYQPRPVALVPPPAPWTLPGWTRTSDQIAAHFNAPAIGGPLSATRKPKDSLFTRSTESGPNEPLSPEAGRLARLMLGLSLD